MTRISLALLAGVVLWLLILGPPAPANAAPLCEHRSAAHIAEHGGLKADNAWHIAHGQRPTCGDDESHEYQQKQDDGNPWRRDEFGFHCTWHGCG